MAIGSPADQAGLAVAEPPGRPWGASCLGTAGGGSGPACRSLTGAESTAWTALPSFESRGLAACCCSLALTTQPWPSLTAVEAARQPGLQQQKVTSSTAAAVAAVAAAVAKGQHWAAGRHLRRLAACGTWA